MARVSIKTVQKNSDGEFVPSWTVDININVAGSSEEQNNNFAYLLRGAIMIWVPGGSPLVGATIAAFDDAGVPIIGLSSPA